MTKLEPGEAPDWMRLRLNETGEVNHFPLELVGIEIATRVDGDEVRLQIPEIDLSGADRGVDVTSVFRDPPIVPDFELRIPEPPDRVLLELRGRVRGEYVVVGPGGRWPDLVAPDPLAEIRRIIASQRMTSMRAKYDAICRYVEGKPV